MKEQEKHTFTIRPAVKEDAALVFYFIRQIAIYEQMLDQVENTEALVRKVVFEDGAAEAVIAEEDGKPVGFALFYTTYSTFVGRPGIHLEDLFIEKKHRGKGYGKLLLQHLAALTLERGYGRLEWCCLNWNEPSLRFYRSLGASSLDEWIDFRLQGSALSDALKR